MISRPIPDSGPGRLRPFCRDDIPAVVALRPQAFRFSEHPSAPALAAYFEWWLSF